MREIKLDQITFCADGSVGIRLLKQFVDNGEVLFSEPHRTVVEPLGDVAEQVAVVNAHLAGMSFPAIPSSALKLVEDLRAIHLEDDAVKARVAEIRIARDKAETSIESEEIKAKEVSARA